MGAGGERYKRSVSAARGLMIKHLLLLQFPLCTHACLLYGWPPFFCRTLRHSCPQGHQCESERDSHTSLSSRQHWCTTETPHLHMPYTPLCLALTQRLSSLPPSHVSTPPPGSSKYFPSLLFEASMGQATSCTNHAALPWGSVGSESDAWKPNLHCFHRGLFFLPRQPSPISGGS